ncbi:MAG TPA: hypothetical protein VN837_12705, partial [Chloroflexota bacterium]|nr:hypothetical protein [Chloroflexota bacterium]
ALFTILSWLIQVRRSRHGHVPMQSAVDVHVVVGAPLVGALGGWHEGTHQGCPYNYMDIHGRLHWYVTMAAPSNLNQPREDNE